MQNTFILKYWVGSKVKLSLLRSKQAGFRRDHSSLGHGFVLQHLVEKYTLLHKGTLLVAILDLKSALDLIPKERLWGKFQGSSADKMLLLLIHIFLNCNILLRVRCFSREYLSWRCYHGKSSKIRVASSSLRMSL